MFNFVQQNTEIMSKSSIFTLALTLIGLSSTVNAQTTSPTIEPGIGYVFNTGYDFSAVRVQIAARNLFLSNKLGLYYTIEKNSAAVGPSKTYLRDIAGINYRLSNLISVQAAGGLFSNSFFTESSKKVGGMRKEVSLVLHPVKIPLTFTLGYSSTCGVTTTFGYRIPLKKTIEAVSAPAPAPAPAVEEPVKKEETPIIVETPVEPEVVVTAPVVETPPVVKEIPVKVDVVALCSESKSHFPFKIATLSDADKQRLLPLSKYLLENTNSLLRIYGSTDNVGSEKYNMELSELRANNVKAYLVFLGVPAQRISVIPLGMTKSRNASTEEEKAEARNASFEIYNP